MLDKETIQQWPKEVKREYSEWTYDIPLPFDIWTRRNLDIPHTRQILDLGCLDGILSIEFALHGV